MESLLSQQVQELRAQLAKFEQAASQGMGTLFHNQNQLKKGLDSAEANYRAMAKVLNGVVTSLTGLWVDRPDAFPVIMLDGKIDWGAYYRSAEDDMEAEQIAAYKVEVQQRLGMVAQIEAELEGFEAALADEVAKKGGEDSEYGKVVVKFLSDVRREMAKVKDAAKAVEAEGFSKKDIVEFKDKILHDTLFMISRSKKKEAAPAPTAPQVEETVTEFGG